MAWVHLMDDATVFNAHCDCVAGLGECCSHVGAVLFALNAVHTNMYENEPQSVTDVKAYWVVPSCKNALHLCNAEINYRKGSKRKASSDVGIVANLTSHEKMVEILRKMKSKGQVPAMLDGFDEFVSEDHIESVLLHLYFANLFEMENETENLDVLRRKFKIESFTITKEEAALVEKHTRKQSCGPYWHKLRLGRITASIFKAVCRAKTSVSFPASLLKTICYPSESISTAAIQYGKKNEPLALKNLLKESKKQHTNLTISASGLYIDQNKSFYAASPDGIWSCSCCGRMALEIKCPFLLKDGDFGAYLAHKNCPIIINDTDMYELKKDHQYYYHLMASLFVNLIKTRKNNK